jgi:thymidylate synthase
MGSAHICDRNTERVERVLKEAATRPALLDFRFPSMPASTTAAIVARVLEHEEALRTNKVRYRAADVASLGLEPYWQQALLLFEVYRQLQHAETNTVDAGVLEALEPGLRWLVGHRWAACAFPAGGAR